MIRPTPYRTRFGLAVLAGAATILAGIGLMSTSGHLISRAAERPPILDLMLLIVAVRFFSIARAALRYVERLLSHDSVLRLLESLRVWLYDRLEPRAPHHLIDRRAGDWLSRLVGDVESVQHLYIRVLLPTAVAGIVILCTVVALGFIDARLAAAVLVLLLIHGSLGPLVLVRLARGAGEEQVRALSSLSEQWLDSIQGMADLLMLGVEHERNHDTMRRVSALARVQERQARLTGWHDAIGHALLFGGVFAALWFGVPPIVAGDLAGAWLALLVLGVMASFECVQTLGPAYQHLEQYRHAARRIRAYAPHETTATHRDEPPPAYDIAFENVRFSYHEDEMALNDVSFRVAEREHVAVVGTSGSGKTTLTHLLFRFADPQSGHILLGGEPIARCAPDAVRTRFSILAQDAHLFNDTIRNNLLIASPDADDEALWTALEQAQLRPWVNSLPEGLDTPVGHFGLRLSGGERTRLAMARALLKPAPILILDEPAANQDALTERDILRAAHQAARNRTLLVITHRLVEMSHYNRILVLDRGRIIQSGAHSTLRRQPGAYRAFLDKQLQVLESV